MRRNKTPLSTLIGFLFLVMGTAEAYAQETYSVTAVGGPPKELTGEIRWKKALGTVPFTFGLSAPHSDPCSAFHVLVVTQDDEQKLIAFDDDLTWKAKAGEFNICQFKTTVPSNTPIRVYPAMGRKNGSTEQQENLYLRGGWSGGEKIPYVPNRYGWNWGDTKGRIIYPGNLIDPQPETGYKRGFESRYRELTLARATFIAFEMAYIMNQFGAYPKYTVPPPPAPKPPFITASQPIAIHPTAPLSSVSLWWDGGPDHPNVAVWLSMDNGVEIPAFSVDFAQQSPIWKQPKAGGEMKLQRYHHYKYVLKDTAGKTLSTVSFVVP